MLRYKILEQGPDDRSTYPECWGSQATSAGRLVAEVDDFGEVVEIIHNLGHTNYTIRDRRAHRLFQGPALGEMRKLQGRM